MKNPKKTQKNPKKPKKPQKNPLGWVFLKKPGFFPTLYIRLVQSYFPVWVESVDNDPAHFFDEPVPDPPVGVTARIRRRRRRFGRCHVADRDQCLDRFWIQVLRVYISNMQNMLLFTI